MQYPVAEHPLLLSEFGSAEAAGIITELHRHKALQFTLVLRGSVSYYVDGAMGTAAEGQCFFVNSNRAHRMLPVSDPGAWFCGLRVEPEVLATTELLRRDYLTPLLECEYLSFAIFDADSRAAQALRGMHALTKEEPPELSLRLMSPLMMLFEDVCIRQRMAAAGSGGQRRFSQAERMLNHIAVHYAEPITLSELAAVGNLSKNSCIRIFREHTGVTPGTYLNNYRLQRAVELLQHSEKPITEIAYAVGFSGSSYFTERFRQLYGMTPKEFRKRGGG
ncbi:MAG: AraC family transcriptional regulator [bacterium]